MSSHGEHLALRFWEVGLSRGHLFVTREVISRGEVTGREEGRLEEENENLGSTRADVGCQGIVRGIEPRLKRGRPYRHSILLR